MLQTLIHYLVCMPRAVPSQLTFRRTVPYKGCNIGVVIERLGTSTSNFRGCDVTPLFKPPPHSCCSWRGATRWITSLSMKACSLSVREAIAYFFFSAPRSAVPLKMSRSKPIVPASRAAASVAEIFGVTCKSDARQPSSVN